MVHVRVAPHQQDQFPQLTNDQVLAVLPHGTSRAGLELVLATLAQALVFDGDDAARFNYAVKESPYLPEWNRAQRHAELEVPGLPVVVATRAKVRMVGDQIEWASQPWPDGMTAEDFRGR